MLLDQMKLARRLIIDLLICQALINEQWSEHQVAIGLMAEAEKVRTIYDLLMFSD
jgi:hypothetical protein